MKSNSIEIAEIPYTTTTEAIIHKIVDLIKDGRIKEISDTREETDLKGLRIAIDLKRGADPQSLMKRILKLTPLEDTFSCNFNVLVNGRPVVLGVKGLLDAWIDFRVNCISRKSSFEKVALEDKKHLLEALTKVAL